MTTQDLSYQLIPSGGDNLPSDNGEMVGVNECPAEVTVSILGNVGTGNPVFTPQVKRNGTWVPVDGETITDNQTKTFYIYGEAFRIVTPSLTSPGTGATAPRLAYSVNSLFVPHQSASAE